MLAMPRRQIRTLVCVTSWLWCAAAANAQTAPVLAPQSPVETPRPVMIETNTPAWVLMDMPSSGTLYLSLIHI